MATERKALVQWKTATGEEAVSYFHNGNGFTVKLKEEGALTCTATGNYEVSGEVLSEIKEAETEATPKKLVEKCPGIASYWAGEEPRSKFTLGAPLEVGKVGALEAGEMCGEYELTLKGGKAFRVKDA